MKMIARINFAGKSGHADASVVIERFADGFVSRKSYSPTPASQSRLARLGTTQGESIAVYHWGWAFSWKREERRESLR